MVHYNSYTTLLISRWLREYPSVLHAREVMREPSRLLPVVKYLMRRGIREIIAIAPEEGEQAERVFGLPVTTVFNWPGKPVRLVPMPEARPLVYGVFSHVTPIKGHLECVKACALVADELRKANVRVRLFGGMVPIHAAYHQAVVDEIKASRLSDIVDFPGFVDDPESEMQRVHLVVRPDTTGHAWGRDVIESMSLGRPVLAMGTREVMVKNGRTGKLTPVGDIRALARGMVELADFDTLRAFGENACKFAREHFDPEVNAARIIERMRLLAGAGAG